MLTERLVARCPSAKVIGVANAANHTLNFLKPSIDNSGKATLLAAGAVSSYTPGMLFEIAQTDLGNLDAAEGAGYKPYDNFQVWRAETGETVSAKTYIATKIKADVKPYDWYLALVIAGARQHGLGRGYVHMLCQTECDDDPDPERSTRIKALCVLKLAGHEDYRDLLIDGN